MRLVPGVYLNFGESVTVVAELFAQVINNWSRRSLHSIEFFQPGKGKGKKSSDGVVSGQVLSARPVVPQWRRTPCGKPHRDNETEPTGE